MDLLGKHIRAFHSYYNRWERLPRCTNRLPADAHNLLYHPNQYTFVLPLREIRTYAYSLYRHHLPFLSFDLYPFLFGYELNFSSI
ncbi:hypothetical protein, partial [Bacteroides fragilis]|uniref:hypothetical protein n=1 Tax=Bacteroides fragilis TaxID=817 RepID=UPI001E4C32AE